MDFLFVPESTGGSGGGIEDVPLETENPKYYARYSGDKTWKVLLPPEGRVVTTSNYWWLL